MKALIPAAGIGTRLRPHTLNKPKALLPVAGRPILGHIIDDLIAAGIDGFVIIVGYEADAVKRWFTATYPDRDVTFVEQAERLGLGHAVWTAREAIGDESFFCILGDTILKADYGSLLGAGTNVIAVREVEDARRFGVVEMDGTIVRRFVEKPDVPPSNLAIVGAYLFHDAGALWHALDRIVSDDVRTRGEYQLTDALQLMVQDGVDFRIVSVTDWYDCGKRETWIETNRVLLDGGGAGEAMAGVTPPCCIGPDCVIENSTIGPYVSIGAGCRILDSELRDSVVDAGSEVVASRLHESLIGAEAHVRGVRGSVNIGDWCEIEVNEE